MGNDFAMIHDNHNLQMNNTKSTRFCQTHVEQRQRSRDSGPISGPFLVILGLQIWMGVELLTILVASFPGSLGLGGRQAWLHGQRRWEAQL